MSVSAWVVCGPSMTGAYDNRREAELAGETYSGPMDDTSYEIMSTMTDLSAVRPLYKTKNVNGNQPFILFAMNFDTDQDATDALDYLDFKWEGQQIEIQGVWNRETGLELGVTGIYDTNGELIEKQGDPTYPINPTAYELMPDGQNGNPATSNADLQDVNLVYGQTPRDFSGAIEAAQFFEVLEVYGEATKAARFRLTKDIPAGTEFAVICVIRNNGDMENIVFKHETQIDLTKQQAANILGGLLEFSLLFEATINGLTVSILPENPNHTFYISTRVRT